MSVVKLKRDLQQAIANNMMNYKANYNGLLFSDSRKEIGKCFEFMKELKIKVKDNKLIYNIELDEEVLSTLTQDTIAKIKKSDMQYKAENALLEKMAETNIIIEQVYDLNEEKDEEKKYREPTEKEKLKMFMIHQLVLQSFNVNLKLQQSETFLSLYGVFDELCLNKESLLNLNFLIDHLDVVAILPQYEDDEESEEVLGIRLFLGISLEE